MAELAEHIRIGGAVPPKTFVDDFRDIVTSGEIVELAHVLCEDIPHSAQHPPFMFRLTKLHGDGKIGTSDTTVSSDMFFMGSHNGTHMDGLNHIGCCGMVYSDVDADEVGSRLQGYSVHGMETVAPVFCRGVLLDTTLLSGGDALPSDRSISREDLAEVARIEDVEIRPGDAVLIRTGWQRFWTDHRKYVGALDGHPGPDQAAAAWLGDIGIRVTGTDTFGYDRRPSHMPAHIEFMVKRGVHIMENLCLDDLAERKAFEFMFCALPLRILGGTGSPIRPIALV